MAPDAGIPHLVGGALVGLLAALAALALFGARGDWSGGLSLAGVVLLLTGVLLVTALRQRSRTSERRTALATARRLIAAMPEPALLYDEAGRLLAANRHYGERFRCDPPALVTQLGAECHDADGRAHRVIATPFDGGRLLTLLPTAGKEDGEAPAAGGLPSAALGEALGALGIGCALVAADGTVRWINARAAHDLDLKKGAVPDPEFGSGLRDPERHRQTLPGGGEQVKHVVALAGGEALVLLRGREADGARTALPDAEQWKILFDTAPLGLAIVNPEGRLLAFNKPFRRFAPNRTPRQGDRLTDFVAGDDGSEVARRIKAALDGAARASPLEVSFNTQPARTGQIAFSRLPGDGPGRILVHLVDTTKHRSLERQFVQAQKMQAVGQLAGGVAHDFNNLLTAIIGFCDLLLVRHGPGDQSFSDIMQIKQNANRAANLVRQLLAFSRQQTMRPKVLVITDVLADLSNLLRHLIGETIELKMIHGRDLGPVKVDQGQLEQVIINLAVNARDAMPDGGTLTIRTKNVGPDDRLVQHYSVMPAGNYVLIEITDTGEGIPAENLNKIFEPFFTTKSVGKGTGLGLSTVYGIIKQTGGFIFVESAPGEGATFRVYLPRHEEAVEERPRAEAGPAADLTGRGTILLVEDEEAVRMFASRALTNKGYKVLQAASGEEALAIVRDHEESVDLLISDVVMPNMDGPTLVAEAKHLRPDLRVIFISGYAEDVFKATGGTDMEGYAFLPKPFSLKQLAETVKATLS
ncbi:MAG: ATP-binding protein [Rhodothalassiaceae bacterium]